MEIGLFRFRLRRLRMGRRVLVVVPRQPGHPLRRQQGGTGRDPRRFASRINPPRTRALGGRACQQGNAFPWFYRYIRCLLYLLFLLLVPQVPDLGPWAGQPVGGELRLDGDRRFGCGHVGGRLACRPDLKARRGSDPVAEKSGRRLLCSFGPLPCDWGAHARPAFPFSLVVRLVHGHACHFVKSNEPEKSHRCPYGRL